MTLYGLQSRLLTSGLQPYIERTEDKKIKETTFGTTSDGRRVGTLDLPAHCVSAGGHLGA